MADSHFEDEYEAMKSKNSALQAELDELKGKMKEKDAMEHDNGKDPKENGKEASKDAGKNGDGPDGSKNLEERMAAIEEHIKAEDEKGKQALAVRLANLEIEANTISKDKFDDQVKMHKTKTSAELQAAMPYAEDLAKKEKSAASRSALRLPPKESRYGDPNGENRQAAEADIGSAVKAFRSSIYG